VKFGKRFSLLAALTMATAVFPVLGARAQDKSGCSLSASDCALIAAAETNIAKETSFTQDFEFDTTTSVGLQNASLQVTGKGPLSHDATSTDFLNAYQVQLDLSGARTGSGNDAKGTIGLVLTGGALYFNYEKAPPAVVDRVRRLESICDEFDIPLAAAALQFPLAHPQVASVIPGLCSAQHVELTAKSYATIIPAAFWQELKRAGLLHADAPIPLK